MVVKSLKWLSKHN